MIVEYGGRVEKKNKEEEKSTLNGAVSSKLEITWKLEQGSEIMIAFKKIQQRLV